MDEVKKSIVESLDGTGTDLLPYLPYILQDLWEMGADPLTILALIKENIRNTDLRILDLGCGKGAVSISLAKYLRCTVLGIDAMPEFIDSAKEYAEKYDVKAICKFEVNDIRTRINELKGFDLIVLGAIGPILGDIFQTLNRLTLTLNDQGYVLMVEAYIPDESSGYHRGCLRKSEFYNQILAAGFEIVKEVISDKSAKEENDRSIYESIARRVNELIIKYPHKKNLFQDYLESQEYENHMLENELICGTWLLQLTKLRTKKAVY